MSVEKLIEAEHRYTACNKDLRESEAARDHALEKVDNVKKDLGEELRKADESGVMKVRIEKARNRDALRSWPAVS